MSRWGRLRALVAVTIVGAAVVLALPSAASASTFLPAAPTHVAAASLCGGCVNDVVVARLPDGRLFYTIGSENHIAPGNWRVWTEIPGGGRTPYAPELTLAADGWVRLVIVGANNRVYHNAISQQSGWYGWSEVPGNGMLSESAAIVASPYGHLFTIFGRGTDGGLWYQTYGSGWWGWRKVPGNVYPASGVTAIEFQSKTYVAFRGTDNRIYIGSSDLYWDGWTASDVFSEVPGGLKTYHTPALTRGSKNSLHVLMRGTEDMIWYQSLVVVANPNMPLVWTGFWGTTTIPGHALGAPAASEPRGYFCAYIVGPAYADGIWTQCLRAQNNGLLADEFGHGWVRIPGSLPTAATLVGQEHHGLPEGLLRPAYPRV